MKHLDKYTQLMKRKSTKFTTDNRPIEVYSKGKEKIYVAFSPNNEMEIVMHNPFPLLAAAGGFLVRKGIQSAAVRGVSSLLNRKKPLETENRNFIKSKSLSDNIIEAEVYNDKDFSIM